MNWRAALSAAVIGALGFAVLMPRPAASAEPADFPIPNGHIFKQTSGQGGAGDLGFAVTDDDRIPFWTVYQRLGGPAEVGYPLSQRFAWNGYVSQAFQKTILQWSQQTQSVVFVNVFDELGRSGRDGWLADQKRVPPPADFGDTSRPWDEIVRTRLAVLEGFPRLKERYQRSVDPVAQFGLPTSRVVVRDDAFVVRLQRAVIEEWRVDRPGLKAGDVTLANAGEMAREVGLIPAAALAPSVWVQPRQPAPAPVVVGQPAVVQPLSAQPAGAPPAAPRALAPRAVTLAALRQPPRRADGHPWRVVIDPGHGGSEAGAVRTLGTGLVLAEKDVNLVVSLRLAGLLRGAGIEVALTRDSDRRANDPGYDLNQDGRVNTSDDLQARAEIANQFGADIFVSVHNNGHANPALYGTEVYYNGIRPYGERNRALAWYLDQRIVQLIQLTGYPTQDRGIKTDLSAGHGGYFAVLGPQSDSIPSPTRMPATLTESLFVSSYYDAPWLTTPQVVEAIARGHAEGIVDYFEWLQNRG